MQIYDLSPLITPKLPVWPGDTPFSSRPTVQIGANSPVNLSAFSTTPHLGSHVDAPYHTEPQGLTVDDLPLAPYLGPCRVVAVPAVDVLYPRHLPPPSEADFEEAPRVLFKTSSVASWDSFPEEFTALSAELADQLAQRGIVLVGLDTPSVDPYSSKTLDAHHALVQNGVAILEGLLLDPVPPGVYELIALPLRIQGLDASPVRAILRTRDDEAGKGG